MADIPFRRPYLFNSYPLQICFMFILHFIGRGSTFFLIISCSPSGFVTLHFKSCYVILCALCCACVLLPFCLQLCSSHVLHLYVFVLFFCFALFFLILSFFSRCLFTRYPHCESTLLSLARRPEDIRDNRGSLSRKATGGWFGGSPLHPQGRLLQNTLWGLRIMATLLCTTVERLKLGLDITRSNDHGKHYLLMRGRMTSLLSHMASSPMNLSVFVTNVHHSSNNTGLCSPTMVPST